MNTATAEFAAAIKAQEAAFKLVEPIACSYCDPAGKAANTQTAKTEFDVFAASGSAAATARALAVRDGCVQIMDLLADEELPLVVASRCEGLIRALSQVKPHRANRRSTTPTTRLLASARCPALSARRRRARGRLADGRLECRCVRSLRGT